MKRTASNRVVARIAGLLLSLAPASDSLATSARRYVKFAQRSQPAMIAQLSEENIPASGMAGSGTGGDAGPRDGSSVAETPSAMGDWERVPNDSSAAPAQESQPAAADTAAAGSGPITRSARDSVAHTAPAEGPAASSAGVPDSAALGPPPALDASTITTTPDPSEAPLDQEIARAESPSLVASMRVTEQARKELARGKTDDAIRTLGRAVSIEPANPFEYFYLGRSYMVKKNYQQALTFFKRAEIGLGSRPDWHGAALSYEGACYEVLGKTVDAAQAYQRALAQAPNNLMARVGYSRLAGNIALPLASGASSAPSADQTDSGPPTEAPAPPPPAQPPPLPAAPPAQ